jgi:peptide/nickel transport system ATP-binding protein
VLRLLKIEGLRVSYDENLVLNGIDLELETGEALAVIGESGTGKTTLGLSIMRLVGGTVQGAILFDEKDLLKLADEEMRPMRWNRIAMVFQNVNNVLNPVYTVLDQVIEPMIEHGLYSNSEAYSKATKLLAYFKLPQERFSAYPHQLSAGEQQRVLIAMALANDPDLLILDEPLSSLDAISRAGVGKLLKASVAGHTTLVFTHDLATASRLTDRIAVLYGGKIAELGPAQDVLSRPRHPYTRALIRAYPNMTTVKDLQGIKGRMTRAISGCPFHPRCTQAIDICSREVPHLVSNQGHQVACHRGGVITLLSTKDLTKFFGAFQAVNSVNLHIEGGETLALVGESGSGKTTLAKTIMGLYHPTGGSVYWEGAKIDSRRKDFYQRVQMIFQNPGESLSHRLSVLEAVVEPLDVQRIGTRQEREHKAIRVLEEVELPQTGEFLGKYPHQLGGGEVQRVAIARALVLEPKLLIADEPTSFLDASVQAKILKLLLNLQEQRGLSMLFITHDIALARKISDRMAIMIEGKIIEEGTSSQIVVAPKHSYTETLLNTASALHID